jgi:hypothetical protein
MDHYPHSTNHELISRGKQFSRLSTARQDDSWDSCKEDNKQICHYPKCTSTVTKTGSTVENVPVQLQKRARQCKIYQYSYNTRSDREKCMQWPFHFPGTTVQGTYLTSNSVAGVGYSTILDEVGTQLKIPTRRGGMGLKLNNSAATGGRVWTCRIRLGDVVE